ncbi:MAG: cobyric acid synthase, partial [Bradyrhizobium sp.]
LDVTTVITPKKSLTRVKAVHADTGEPFEAYEIHMGRTEGKDLARPFAFVGGAPEGAASADSRVQGSYLHGLFAADGFRGAYLKQLGITASGERYRDRVESALDALAGHIETHLDVDGLLALAR